MIDPVAGGQWSVEGGQWSVVSGQWSVVGGQWSVTHRWYRSHVNPPYSAPAPISCSSSVTMVKLTSIAYG